MSRPGLYIGIAAIVLASCKTRTDQSGTKDALIPLGDAEGGAKPFVLFLNDDAHKQICAVECNDVNPVQVPQDQAQWSNRLRCKIDMSCEPTEAFQQAYLARSRAAPSPELDTFYASLLGGFTTYAEPSGNLVEEAKTLLAQIKKSGTAQPISAAITDRYLTRKVSSVASASTDPETQKAIDAQRTQLQAVREQQRQAAEAEAKRLADLARQQDAERKHRQLEQLRKTAQSAPAFNSLCGASAATTYETRAHDGAIFLDIHGRDCDCLYQAFPGGRLGPGYFKQISAGSGGLGTNTGMTLLPSTCSLYLPDSTGFDSVGFGQTIYDFDLVYSLMNDMKVGATSPDVIDLKASGTVQMANGQTKPSWELRCDLSGTETLGTYPHCRVEINHTMTHQNAENLARLNANAEAARQAQQAADAAAAQANATVTADNRPEMLAYLNSLQLRFLRTDAVQLDGSGRPVPIRLIYNPQASLKVFALGFGPHCRNAGITSITVDVHATGSAMAVTYSTPTNNPQGLSAMFLVNNAGGGMIGEIDFTITSAACDDVQYWTN